jgi:tRNA(Ile)-lysidine synthase
MAGRGSSRYEVRHVLIDQLAQRLDQLPRPRRILAAVSGGADSMALLRGLLELQQQLGLVLHVGHLDHQLRSEASTADAAWLEQVCAVRGIPITVGRVDVGALARDSTRGIEEAARDARYAFLAETARSTGSSVIALAHTADDQAETILHHIVRGTGLAGLRGIPPERELAPGLKLIRPMLEVSRSQVLDYLRLIGQDFREDESNQDDSYTRNRIRRNLLPLLAADYNPQIAEALRRLGEQASAAQETLETLAANLLERVMESSSQQECRLKWQPLVDVPRHLVREMFSILWRQQDWPRQQMGFAQWDELAGIAREGGAATLPSRIDARREGRWINLRRPASERDN